jgi:hypothetical protein
MVSGVTRLPTSSRLFREDFAFDGQAAPLVVIEQNAFLAELFSEHLIFSSQVLDGVLLVVIDPPGQTDQEQVPRL